MVFDMLKLLILGVVFCYGRGDVVNIRYPINNPCILIEIDAKFQLVWTDMNGKEQTVPDFTLNDTTVSSGNCAKYTPSLDVVLSWSDGSNFIFSFTNQSDTTSYDCYMRYSPKSIFTNTNQTGTRPYFTLNGSTVNSGFCALDTSSPQIYLSWSDGGTFTFTFTNKSDTICYGWNMRYSPNSVFTNNKQTGVLSHSGYLGSGSSTKAFACQHVPLVNNTQTSPGMNKYQLTITIKSIKAQAFNVNDGKFSEEERCPADAISTVTKPSASPSSTTKPTIATTKSTNATTKPTPASTKPTNSTTKPTPASTKPTNSTTKPTPASTKPTNVTTKPTTATTKLTTATTKPTNATTKPTAGTTKPSTVPTPAPTPVPAPNAHATQTFKVFAEDKQCVLMQGEFLFTLVYPKDCNTNGSVDIGLQEIRSVSGDCLANDYSENIVTIEFYDGWMVMITLSKKPSSRLRILISDSNTQYFWSRLYLRYNYATELGGTPLFPNVETHTTAPELNVSFADGTYEASTDGSYLCNSNQHIDLMGGNKLQTWNLQYDAFRTKNRTTFSNKNIQECSKDSKINNIIPIAAGGSLAVMALVVLFAYLTRRIKLHIRLEFESDDVNLITRPNRST